MGNKGDVILDTPDTPFAQKQKAIQYNFYSIFAKLLVPSCQGDPDCSGSQHCCQLVLAANLSMYKSVQHDYYSIRFLSLSLLCYYYKLYVYLNLLSRVFLLGKQHLQLQAVSLKWPSWLDITVACSLKIMDTFPIISNRSAKQLENLRVNVPDSTASLPPL